MDAGSYKSDVWYTFTSLLSTADLDPLGMAPLKGDIALFILYKGCKLDYSDIKVRHKVFCDNWYKIDREPINI